MHNNSMKLYMSHGKLFVHDKVLEIGPDASPSSLQQRSAYTSWDTADSASEGFHGCSLTFPGCEEYKLPVEDNTYDTVVSANVLEHVRMPWRLLAELARVVQPGGHIVTVVPALYVFHQHPVDCWRVWPDGMHALHEWAGLQTVLAEYSIESTTVADTIGVARKPLRVTAT
jgi:SAM-dependent methyltransferase